MSEEGNKTDKYCINLPSNDRQADIEPLHGDHWKPIFITKLKLLTENNLKIKLKFIFII